MSPRVSPFGWPFLYGIYISLFQFDFLRPERRPFVGLKNYADLFNPESVPFDDFWNSLSNTGEFILWSVLPLVGIALVLAVLLNRNYPGRGLFRTIFFAPYTLSVTVAAVLAEVVRGRDADAGVFAGLRRERVEVRPVDTAVGVRAGQIMGAAEVGSELAVDAFVVAVGDLAGGAVVATADSSRAVKRSRPPATMAMPVTRKASAGYAGSM